jgi:hypothetical protein
MKLTRLIPATAIFSLSLLRAQYSSTALGEIYISYIIITCVCACCFFLPLSLSCSADASAAAAVAFAEDEINGQSFCVRSLTPLPAIHSHRRRHRWLVGLDGLCDVSIYTSTHIFDVLQQLASLTLSHFPLSPFPPALESKISFF